MRVLTLIACLTLGTGCSLGLDFQDNLAEDYQYTNFIAKYEPTSDHDWSLVLNPDIQPTAIMIDSLDNTIILGSYEGAPDLGQGPIANGGEWGLFAAKYSPEGELIWAKGFGETFMSVGGVFSIPFSAIQADATLDESDNIIIAGSFATSTLDFGGGPLDHPEDELLTNIFLAKLDSDGEYLWANVIGADSGDNEFGMSVATDLEGNIVLAGSTQTPLDPGDGGEVEGSFLAGFDSDGTIVWSTDLCDVSQCMDLRLTTDTSGDILLTGAYLGELDLGGGPLEDSNYPNYWSDFAALFNSVGEHVWSTSFGFSGTMFGFPGCASVFDNDDNMIIVGTATFYSSSSNSEGRYIIFVTKVDQLGEHIWDIAISLDAGQYYQNVNIDSVVIDSEGNIILTGLFMGQLAVGTGPPLGHEDDGDAFLIKLDPNGNHLWSMAFERGIPPSTQGIEYSFVTTAVAVDSLDNIVFVSGSPVS